MLFAWYTDILALQIPLFAYFVCPICIFAIVGRLVFNRVGVKAVFINSLFGVPVVLFVTSVLSLVFSQLHDRWLMDQVRQWGLEIRGEYVKNGKYPPTIVKNLHGYRAQFINRENDYDKHIIYFHKFGQMRQSYSVDDDHFLDETES